MPTVIIRHHSLDSTSPFITPSNRASRYSTFSVAAPSVSSQSTTDSTAAEIREITTGLRRMENKALQQQRVVLSDEKIDCMGKLALGAKLERALDRRMSGQDAVMRPRRKTAPPTPAAAVIDAAAAIIGDQEKRAIDDADAKTVVAGVDEAETVPVGTAQ